MEQQVWSADLGDGTFRNPILYADYSDPDVIRVGNDYFMVTSSFCNTPAIPILHSKDLVNWRVIHYVMENIPFPGYELPAHGRGVWAPAIRHHDGKFWVFFPMPDEGIFCCTAQDPFGAWSEPFPVRLGKGWIDPCPFWDDDGKAYLVSAYAKSRIGIKSILHLSPMKPDGTGLLDEGRDIFDGRHTQPTIEGPKLYKRGGYYYILAPAGGVRHGWQTALRSKHIEGPYEEKIVMFRGGTAVNGPHQGALVTTQTGEDWFLHFQDVGTCGRILHLQPVQWVDDWPVIGEDPGADGCGQPVAEHRKPNVGAQYPPVYPADSDSFDAPTLGLQWQWNANHLQDWYLLSQGMLTLFARPMRGKLCDVPNLLLQKFPAPNFQATVKWHIDNLKNGESAGLVVLGGIYSAISLRREGKELRIETVSGLIKEGGERVTLCARTEISGVVYVRLRVSQSQNCVFSYSVDGEHFWDIGSPFQTTEGIWVGAKFGLYCNGGETACGSASADWVHVGLYSGFTFCRPRLQKGASFACAPSKTTKPL